MCSVKSGSERELEKLVGMPTDPPPLGANEVTIEARDEMFPTVTLRLPDRVMRLRDLEKRFGIGNQFPSPSDDFDLLFFEFDAIDVPSAPHACMLFAETRWGYPPSVGSVVEVRLRLALNSGAA
jgi:hypothetical protein